MPVTTDTAEAGRRSPRAVRRWVVPLVAVVAWLVTLPLALKSDVWSGQNPFTVQGQALGYAVAFTAAAALLALWFLVRSEVVIGAAAGVTGSAAAAFVQLNLTGTPFGYGGISADVGRYTAMAGRYTVATGNVDAFVPGAPSEYPPLIPLLIGRVGAALDTPAWQLMGAAEAVLVSAAVVAAFLLWQRLVPSFVALVLAVVPLAVQPDPRKAFQLLVLATLAPWVIATFARRPGRRGHLHWVLGGLVGGLLVLTYPGYVVFVSLGVLAIVVRELLVPAGRRAYVAHVLLVGVVAAVTVSWYVVPFVLQRGSFVTGSVTDRFASLTIIEDPTGFATGDPFPPVFATLFVAGVVALAWWGTRIGWARALGLLLLGAAAYRLWRLDLFVATGSTGFLHYVGTVITLLILSAGVLGIWRGGRALPRLVGRSFPASTVALVVAGAVLVSLTALQSAIRLPLGPQDDLYSRFTVEAHAQRWPNCDPTRYGTPSLSCFPAREVRTAVVRSLGPDALPVTLSFDERIFAFYPWYAFVTNDRTSAGLFQAFDSRVPVLQELAGRTSPSEMASAMASTSFGPIDVLVLRDRGSQLAWTPAAPTAPVVFSRSAFDGPEFTVTDLEHGVTVVVRNGAQPARAAYPV